MADNFLQQKIDFYIENDIPIEITDSLISEFQKHHKKEYNIRFVLFSMIPIFIYFYLKFTENNTDNLLLICSIAFLIIVSIQLLFKKYVIKIKTNAEILSIYEHNSKYNDTLKAEYEKIKKDINTSNNAHIVLKILKIILKVVR